MNSMNSIAMTSKYAERVLEHLIFWDSDMQGILNLKQQN